MKDSIINAEQYILFTEYLFIIGTYTSIVYTATAKCDNSRKLYLNLT